MRSFKSIVLILLINFTIGVLSLNNNETSTLQSVTTTQDKEINGTGIDSEASVAPIKNNGSDAKLSSETDDKPTHAPVNENGTTKPPPLNHSNKEQKLASAVTNETNKTSTKPEKQSDKSGGSRINAGFIAVTFMAMLLISCL